MNRITKISAFVLVALIIGVTGCGSSNDKSSDPQSPEISSANESPTTALTQASKAELEKKVAATGRVLERFESRRHVPAKASQCAPVNNPIAPGYKVRCRMDFKFGSAAICKAPFAQKNDLNTFVCGNAPGKVTSWYSDCRKELSTATCDRYALDQIAACDPRGDERLYCEHAILGPAVTGFRIRTNS